MHMATARRPSFRAHCRGADFSESMLCLVRKSGGVRARPALLLRRAGQFGHPACAMAVRTSLERRTHRWRTLLGKNATYVSLEE
jgi:hypothetical protein